MSPPSRGVVQGFRKEQDAVLAPGGCSGRAGPRLVLEAWPLPASCPGKAAHSPQRAGGWSGWVFFPCAPSRPLGLPPALDLCAWGGGGV